MSESIPQAIAAVEAALAAEREAEKRFRVSCSPFNARKWDLTKLDVAETAKVYAPALLSAAKESAAVKEDVARLLEHLTAERKAWGDIQAAVGLGFPALVFTSHEASLDNANETLAAVQAAAKESAAKDNAIHELEEAVSDAESRANELARTLAAKDAEIERLRSEVASLRADAERYRKIKEAAVVVMQVGCEVVEWAVHPYCDDDDFDLAIDRGWFVDVNENWTLSALSRPPEGE